MNCQEACALHRLCVIAKELRELLKDSDTLFFDT